MEIVGMYFSSDARECCNLHKIVRVSPSGSTVYVVTMSSSTGEFGTEIRSFRKNKKGYFTSHGSWASSLFNKDSAAYCDAKASLSPPYYGPSDSPSLRDLHAASTYEDTAVFDWPS